jgi:DNA-binding NtrC family response regulator
MTMMNPQPSILRGAKVLVVDDMPANLNVLSEALEGAGYEILAAPSGEVALKIVERTLPDLILLDITMPGLNGYEVCRRLKQSEATQGIPVIFITAHEEMKHVLEGFRVGGVDYISKPFQTEEVLIRVETHLKIHQLTQELARRNAELEAEISRRQQAEQAWQAADEQLSVISTREAERWGVSAFVGRSQAFQRLVQEIRRAQSFGNLGVLITGECGTGKELIARAIHYGGPKAKGPFIPVNCSAIPSELAESTLFGHIKGAFTGATTDRKGCFEQAQGGTLFLDEIGDMPLELQAKLLRVLEDGMVTPLGAVEAKKVEVRVVAATNAELESAMATGKFRKDLFFRLARFAIESPPLRERKEDVGLLAEHFVKTLASDMGMGKASLSAGAVAALEQHDFPGNVRELRNLIERALIDSGGGVIGPDHLPAAIRSSGAARPTEARAEPVVAALASHLPGTQIPNGTKSEEAAILDYTCEHGGINNAECRDLLQVGMHRAWYLLRKLHRSGRLKQDNSGRWTQYRLP